MLNSYVRLRESTYRFANNERGVVSFEYVIVAACVVAAVVAAFGNGTSGAIFNALTGAIAGIVAQIPGA
jgi:pilus assembly protein Flp/PilA